MKAAKSEDGLSRGRMRNSDSGYKCWIQALNHFSCINNCMEEGMKKHGPQRPCQNTMSETLKQLDLSSNG